jgi:hypothetical protein
MKTLVTKNKLWLADIILSSFMFTQCQQEEHEALPQNHRDYEDEHPRIFSEPMDLPEMKFQDPKRQAAR